MILRTSKTLAIILLASPLHPRVVAEDVMGCHIFGGKFQRASCVLVVLEILD